MVRKACCPVHLLRSQCHCRSRIRGHNETAEAASAVSVRLRCGSCSLILHEPPEAVSGGINETAEASLRPAEAFTKSFCSVTYKGNPQLKENT
jgi:hypothetical protein